MALTILENEFALTNGCDLWIVADGDSSRWSRRIDWLLNFQMRRAALHRVPQAAPELIELIKECEIKPTPIPELAPSAPLLIASARLLPTKQTVMVPASDVATWTKACHRVWLSLGRPLTRVFLPESFPSDQLSRHWPTDDAEPRGIELVL